jgi:cytochrome b561
MRDSKQKFSTATVGLHWLVAIVIFGLWPLGFYMARTRTYSLWPLHQSTGTVLLVVILIRLAWRFQNGWPQPVSVYSRMEQVLARTVHWTLVVSLLVMPLTGLISGYAGGYDIVAADAIHKLKVNPRSEALHDFLQVVHIYVSRILAAAVLLHVAGALKHHLVDKDGTLRRMLGARVA